MPVSNSDTIGRGAAAICHGTGGAAEVLRDARGPPGPLCTVRAGAAAGVSCAHGCRVGYELSRTPSASSPAVGKGGPLGPGCLIPAAAKPGGGHQSGADARIPGRAAEPLRAVCGPPVAVRAGRMPGHRQGGGAAAGLPWPS